VKLRDAMTSELENLDLKVQRNMEIIQYKETQAHIVKKMKRL